MEAELKGRPNRLGIYVAAAYLLVVVGVYAVTAYNTKPDNVGYDWIPFVMLAMPWVAIGRAQEFLIPGLIANVVIFYLFGTLLEIARRRIFQR